MSVYRFLTAGKRGTYGVHRGNDHLGFVEKNVYHLRGETYPQGWTPTTPDRRTLKTEATRAAAARALWEYRQAKMRER